jgi:hypothetical protein
MRAAEWTPVTRDCGQRRLRNRKRLPFGCIGTSSIHSSKTLWLQCHHPETLCRYCVRACVPHQPPPHKNEDHLSPNKAEGPVAWDHRIPSSLLVPPRTNRALFSDHPPCLSTRMRCAAVFFSRSRTRIVRPSHGFPFLVLMSQARRIKRVQISPKSFHNPQERPESTPR